MQGYVARKGNRWYAVVYEGIDPVTGRERRRWHAAGTDREQAEALAAQLAADARERRGDGRVRLSFAAFVERYRWPTKQMQLRPTTLVGYERNLRLFILPALGDVVLRDLRAETIEALYGRLLLDGRTDGGGGLSAKSVHEVHVLIRNICDAAVRRGLLAFNPARYAAAPQHRRDPHRPRKAWTAGEPRTFLASIVEHRHHDGFQDSLHRWEVAARSPVGFDGVADGQVARSPAGGQ